MCELTIHLITVKSERLPCLLKPICSGLRLVSEDGENGEQSKQQLRLMLVGPRLELPSALTRLLKLNAWRAQKLYTSPQRSRIAAIFTRYKSPRRERRPCLNSSPRVESQKTMTPKRQQISSSSTGVPPIPKTPSSASTTTAAHHSKSSSSVTSSTSYSPNQSAQEVLNTLWNNYQQKTPQRTKLLDVFMGFLVVVGALQFLYCLIVGNYVSLCDYTTIACFQKPPDIRAKSNGWHGIAIQTGWRCQGKRIMLTSSRGIHSHSMPSLPAFLQRWDNLS